MSYFLSITDEETLKTMEESEIIHQLNLANKEILQLEAELKSKENLIKNLLNPIYGKVTHKDPPKIVFNIKEDIFELRNNFCDLSIDVSNMLKNVQKKQNDSNAIDGKNAVVGVDESQNGTMATPHSMIQQAMADAKDRPNREKNIIITFKDQNAYLIDQFIQTLTAVCQLNGIAKLNQKEFEWIGKYQNILKIKTDSKHTAGRVTVCAMDIKNKSAERYKSITIRQDYTDAELNLFNELWKEVHKRNNWAGTIEWTVKDFQIVKIDNGNASLNENHFW